MWQSCAPLYRRTSATEAAHNKNQTVYTGVHLKLYDN